MPASKAMDPLDALQSLINDALVQTGKALRASRKDAQGNFCQMPGSVQSKLPDTIGAFHSALDELEGDIIRAKSVLLRDLNQLQETKRLLAQPSPQPPVESQSTDSMVIDLGSSPAAAIEDHPMTADVATKPMAPFPNMSIDLTGSGEMDISVKEPNARPQPSPPGGMDGSNGNASPHISSGPIAPMSEVQRKPAADMKLDLSGQSHTLGIPDTTGMNFTDMEFMVAPRANIEYQGQTPPANGPSFDPTTFAPADGGEHNMLSLNNLLPTNQPTAQTSSSDSRSQGTARNTQQRMEGKKDQVPDSAKHNEDFLDEDAGAADGMDFDFSLGGTGDDTFDDLMNNRDSTFELIDAGGNFDTAFFGLDKTDET